MKKFALITLNGNDNYGNKLQHYAIQKEFEKFSARIETIRFLYYAKTEYIIKNIYKYLTRKRYRNFVKFDKKIIYSKYCFYYKKKLKIDEKLETKYNGFFVGSDQVWNSSIETFNKFYLLDFIHDNKKKNSLSASFGIDIVTKEYKDEFKKLLKQFNNISVRENAGRKLVEQLTSRKDVEVLIDPTLMLSKEEWGKIAKKPKKIVPKKYILNYFLGKLDESTKLQIEKFAKQNNCEIINLLDKKGKFYCAGPSEFLYLEKNAFMVCTDSFHSCIFAFLFNKPFVVFDRKQDNILNTNSRIITLLEKFDLKDRYFDGKSISSKNLACNYKKSYEILENERKKFKAFLQKCINTD